MWYDQYKEEGAVEFEKLSAPSLKDLFVKQIQGMILSGELPEGTALPPERELA